MQLPVMPPLAPMLAKAVKAIPKGEFSYEPKWDGFFTDLCQGDRDCCEG